jgi:hypothetical protein
MALVALLSFRDGYGYRSMLERPFLAVSRPSRSARYCATSLRRLRALQHCSTGDFSMYFGVYFQFHPQV